jgi:hypothetical protein
VLERRVVLATLALAGCASLPQRDVFVPPYAEKGCWVRLYGERGFAGPMRQLEGPVFVESIGAWMVTVPNMEAAAPQPLFSQVRSLEVGPHARVTGYAEPLFVKPQLELSPGERTGDIELEKRARSLTLRCEA